MAILGYCPGAAVGTMAEGRSDALSGGGLVMLVGEEPFQRPTLFSKIIF
jgi:hypothetical protein